MKIYCFTIRRTKAQSTIQEVEKVLESYKFYLNKLKQDHPTARIEYHFEVVTKSTGLNVHVHGMGAISSGALFLKVAKGYSAKIELCKSQRAWNMYITKNSLSIPEIINAAKVSMLLQDAEPRPCLDLSSDSEEYIEDTDNIVIPKKKLF